MFEWKKLSKKLDLIPYQVHTKDLKIVILLPVFDTEYCIGRVSSLFMHQNWYLGGIVWCSNGRSSVLANTANGSWVFFCEDIEHQAYSNIKTPRELIAQ